ncbi:unnamed protein product [Caenorhabditis brenneri]
MIRKTTIFFLFLALLAIAHAAEIPQDPKVPDNGADGDKVGKPDIGGKPDNGGKPDDKTKDAPTKAPEVGHSEETKDAGPSSDADKKPANSTASAAQYAFGASLVLLATL